MFTATATFGVLPEAADRDSPGQGSVLYSPPAWQAAPGVQYCKCPGVSESHLPHLQNRPGSLLWQVPKETLTNAWTPGCAMPRVPAFQEVRGRPGALTRAAGLPQRGPPGGSSDDFPEPRALWRTARAPCLTPCRAQVRSHTPGARPPRSQGAAGHKVSAYLAVTQRGGRGHGALSVSGVQVQRASAAFRVGAG